MGGIASLEIGKRALAASRMGLDVTSNNIANINTPGYSRRDVVMRETSPINRSGNFVGTGVVVGSAAISVSPLLPHPVIKSAVMNKVVSTICERIVSVLRD